MATDADTGSNGEISYQLSGSEAERFQIDPVTGEITVARPLDFETVTEPFVLTVIARDNGENALPESIPCYLVSSCVHLVLSLCYIIFLLRREPHNECCCDTANNSNRWQ